MSVDGKGHTKKFKYKTEFVFDNRWREITTNLLAFFTLSSFYAGIVGNRPRGLDASYNWIPQALIWSMLVANISHLLANGPQSFWIDLWTGIVIVITSAMIHYTELPHAIEFLGGMLLAASTLAFFWVGLWIMGRVKKLCKCCCRQLREGLVVESIEED